MNKQIQTPTAVRRAITPTPPRMPRVDDTVTRLIDGAIVVAGIALVVVLWWAARR